MSVPPVVFEFEALGGGDGQGEAVDPPGLVGAAVFLEPGSGERFDAVEFLAVDRAERAAVAAGAAGLHFADDHRVARSGHQVEFAQAVPPVAGEDLHPVALQVRGGESFPEPAEPVRAQSPQVHRGFIRRRGRYEGRRCGLVHGFASVRPGRGSRRTLPEPKSSIGSR
jgi:hypothetical protein